jgi:diguanylate cyclase (GGDEF)-like protein
MATLLHTLGTPQHVNPASWLPVIFWTVFGTGLAIGISFLYIALFHTGVSEETQQTMRIAAIAMPLIVAPPVLAYLTLRNRELAIARHQLEILAATDGLTECFNRRAFTEKVDRFLSNCGDPVNGCHGALLVVDADNFKRVNDNFGHDAGDEALRLISGAIRSVLRDGDIAGRMGGEEFGIFLPGSDLEGAASVSERIRSAIAAINFRPDELPCHLSVSVGCTVFADKVAFRSLYRSADQLLYSAKEHGRNRVEVSAHIQGKAA